MGLCALVIGAIGVVAAIASLMVTGAIEEQLRRDLLAAQEVFDQVQHLRFRNLLSVNSMATELPYLKTVMTIPAVDHATLLDGAHVIQQITDSDLLMICDVQGKLLASVTEPARRGDELGGDPAFAAALRGEPFQGMRVTPEGIYQVVASPLLLGKEVVGALLTGFIVDRARIATLERMTRCRVALVGPGQLVCSAAAKRFFASLVERLPPVTADDPAPMQAMRVEGERYLLLAAPFGTSGVSYVLARSLDHDLLFARRLQGWFLMAALGILGLALMIGARFSRRVSQPIQALVQGIQQLAAGNFSSRVTVSSTDELGELAAAFNRMAEELDRLIRDHKACAQSEAVTAAEREQAARLASANAQLTEKVEALEQCHQQLMGREERMLELEREVNALLRDLGRTERYHEG